MPLNSPIGALHPKSPTDFNILRQTLLFLITNPKERPDHSTVTDFAKFLG